jgi:hypothetical protein
MKGTGRSTGKASKRQNKGEKVVSSTMREWKAGDLHSGKGGPVVTSQKQAIAIALSKKAKASKPGRKAKKA